MVKQQSKSILGGGVTRIGPQKTPPRVVTPAGGLPGRWPSNPEVAEIYPPGTMMAARNEGSGPAPDAGLAEKRANQARYDANVRRGAVEQGYDE